MSYAVKEMFLTLQGEGVNAGRRAVFIRFAGCNLWSGRERDRATAICRFCDTDFVGVDGEGGGRFADAAALAEAAAGFWGEEREERFCVLTGGEPMLQVDDTLVDALHTAGFTIAIESNGTLAVHPGLDWVCISPKAGSEVVQRSGDELKLVWPQPGTDVDVLETWDFAHLLAQPLDTGSVEGNAATEAEAIALVMARPRWRLTLQAHKRLGLR
ncbi:7-carboxy-7-deazaguanine synthase [Sphingomonas asaccharolytica]|uniref:7-carboxy-7-deazaguanine synthase n=1 Tax=Sphingomonas asaccharolytica TaxID=40681 RepID=UPI0008304F51|nr:7-carboxy-7-deazaguanine synthase [Sphingomonas asaccharolytica]